MKYFSILLVSSALVMVACAKKSDNTVDESGNCVDKMVNDYNDVVVASDSHDADRIVGACARFLSEHGAKECSAMMSGAKAKVSYRNLEKTCEMANGVVADRKAHELKDAADAKGQCSSETMVAFNLALKEIKSLRYASAESYSERLTTADKACQRAEQSFAGRTGPCSSRTIYSTKWVSYAELAPACSDIYRKYEKANNLKPRFHNNLSGQVGPILLVKNLLDKLVVTVNDGVVLTAILSRDISSMESYYSSGQIVSKAQIQSLLKSGKVSCGMSHGEDINLGLSEGDRYLAKKLTVQRLTKGVQRSTLRLQSEAGKVIWMSCLSEKELTNGDIVGAFGTTLSLMSK